MKFQFLQPFKFAAVFVFVVLAAALTLPTAQAADPQAAATMLTRSNDTIIAELSAKRDAGALNDAQALAIIQTHISPLINFAKLTQRAMGKYWRRADDGERTQVTAAFQQLLEKTYSKLLTKYSGQQVAVVETKQLPNDKAAVFLAISDNTKSVTVEYRFATADDGTDKVTDIKVEGISLVANYRRQFNGLLKQGGVEALLAGLDKLNQR